MKLNMRDDLKNDMLQLSRQLTLDEIDALKYRLSLSAIKKLKNYFDLEDEVGNNIDFYSIIDNLPIIQPYRDRVPEYGIVFKGHPDFLSDELLTALIAEAENFKIRSKPNFDQFIYHVDTDNCSTIAEQLEQSQEVLDFVSKYAGPVEPSCITSYIYYNKKGQCSLPHVDNAFTAVTLMISLKHVFKNSNTTSKSVIYWADKPRFDYQLISGEATIFFGTTMLHGRTPVSEGEEVLSMLLSFRPINHTKEKINDL